LAPVEAIILIAQQQQLQQEAEDFARSLAEPDDLSESAHHAA
jgi:hypothetical protein